MTRFAGVVLLLVASGCSKKEPEVAASDAAVTPASASSGIDAGSVANNTEPPHPFIPRDEVKSRSDPRFAQLGLLDKLALEKADRPKGALRTETVFDAIDSQLKMPVTRRRQVLARTVSAGYCELADADPDITLCVCEYDDQKSIEAGRPQRTVLKVPNREIVEVKLSTITVQLAEAKPETKARSKKILDFVKTL